MTTIAITEELKLTTLKHLAHGKDLDLVAQIVKIPRETVLEIGSLHGYPDPKKLGWAADILEKKINDAAAPPQRRPEPAARPARTQTAGAAHPSPSAAPAPAPTPVTTTATVTVKPDEIRVLLNTAKGHPSKRIQAAADRIFDQLDRLRQLIHDDEEKHAAARKAAADREAARAEVKRLEEQLATAKAKLRPTKPTVTPGEAGEGPTPAAVRAWAADAGVECPSRGRIPDKVRSAYDEAHQDAA